MKLIFFDYDYQECIKINKINNLTINKIGKFNLKINIINEEVKPWTVETVEKYKLKISTKGQITIEAETYVGFLRGLETLS